MLFEKGDRCPFEGCAGVLTLDKSSGKNVIACRSEPTRHYTLVSSSQAAAWERGEAIEIVFETPAPDDHWFSDYFLSGSERIS